MNSVIYSLSKVSFFKKKENKCIKIKNFYRYSFNTMLYEMDCTLEVRGEDLQK